MTHQHTSKVLEWGLNEKHDSIPVKFGCAECYETYTVLPVYQETPSDHSKHDDYVDGCFGCKVRTLELSTGDANGSRTMSQKKWDSELNAYADARSQGIQPAGTTMKAVAAAKDASDKLGSAFNADSMPAADKITKQSAKVMKETGVA